MRIVLLLIAMVMLAFASLTAADNGVSTNGQVPSQVTTFANLAIGEAFFNHSAAGLVMVKQTSALAVDAKSPGLVPANVASTAVVERIVSLTIQIPAPPAANASNP